MRVIRSTSPSCCATPGSYPEDKPEGTGTDSAMVSGEAQTAQLAAPAGGAGLACPSVHGGAEPSASGLTRLRSEAPASHGHSIPPRAPASARLNWPWRSLPLRRAASFRPPPLPSGLVAEIPYPRDSSRTNRSSVNPADHTGGRVCHSDRSLATRLRPRP